MLHNGHEPAEAPTCFACGERALTGAQPLALETLPQPVAICGVCAPAVEVWFGTRNADDLPAGPMRQHVIEVVQTQFALAMADAVRWVWAHGGKIEFEKPDDDGMPGKCRVEIALDAAAQGVDVEQLPALASATPIQRHALTAPTLIEAVAGLQRLLNPEGGDAPAH